MDFKGKCGGVGLPIYLYVRVYLKNKEKVPKRLFYFKRFILNQKQVVIGKALGRGIDVQVLRQGLVFLA